MFKSNLNETARREHKWKEQESALQNIKLLYKARKAVIKLFNDYRLIAFDSHGNRIPSELAIYLKILTPKQLL